METIKLNLTKTGNKNILMILKNIYFRIQYNYFVNILTVAEAIDFSLEDKDPLPLYTHFVDGRSPCCLVSEYLSGATFPLIQKTTKCMKHSQVTILFRVSKQ